MPSAVPYTPRVFVPDRYEPNSGRLVDLARQRGQDQSEAIRRSGELQANLWSGIGQNVAGTLRDLAAMPELARQRQLQEMRLQREEATYQAQQQQQQEEEAKAAKLRELSARYQGQPIPSDVLVMQFGQKDAAAIKAYQESLFGSSRADQQQARIEANELGASLRPGPISEDNLNALQASPAQAGRTRYVFGPGTAEGPELQPTPQQAHEAAVEARLSTPKPETVTFSAPTAAMVGGRRVFVRSGSDGKTYDMAGRVVTSEPTPLPKDEPLGPQPAWQWVTRNGKEVYTNRVAEGDVPNTNRVKATEDERKTAGFYGQMSDAIALMDQLEDAITEQELYQIQSLPQEGLIGAINRGELSEAAKRYVRAFEQFTEARLRPVSGAAISDSEFARDRRTYAKQFKETPALNRDRRTARNRALDSLKKRAGVALDDANPTATVKKNPNR